MYFVIQIINKPLHDIGDRQFHHVSTSVVDVCLYRWLHTKYMYASLIHKSYYSMWQTDNKIKHFTDDLFSLATQSLQKH